MADGSPTDPVRDAVQNVVPPVAQVRICRQETQIRKLIEMNAHNDPLWRNALSEWERDAKQYTERVDKKEKRLETTLNEVYQVLGLLIAFQGLLFGATLPKGQLHCSDRWFILVLSAFATGVAFIAVCQKNGLQIKLENFIAAEDPQRQRLVRRLDNLRLKGTKFDFEEYFRLHEPDQINGSELGFKPRAANFSLSYINWSSLCILMFGILCFVAINNILCHSSVPSPSPSPSV